jgi:RNA polymerase sigma-70 factor (ECF subfamily)
VAESDYRNGTSLSLIELARRRDPVAWQRLCRIYAPLVYSWTRRRGVSQDDAADLVQEVFRIVSTHLERFRHDRPGDTFRGWLLVITSREVRGFYRRQGHLLATAEGGSSAMHRMQEVSGELDLPDDLDDIADDPGAQRDLMLRAAETIRQDYEPHTWQAFWRSVIEGHETADIAADLKMTANAVRQARFRILNRLRETLQG